MGQIVLPEFPSKEAFEEMYKHLPHPPEYPHEHQFTIPVEWMTSQQGSRTTHLNVVTKLRCVCGEETNRD